MLTIYRQLYTLSNYWKSNEKYLETLIELERESYQVASFYTIVYNTNWYNTETDN